MATSGGNTPYNYFTRLAHAFLNGRYWLTENPPWLSELIPVDENKYFVVYPPGPALLSLPFVYLFGQDFPQQIIAHLLGAGFVILTIKLSWTVKQDKKLAIWSGLLVGLGSIMWFLSATGSVWYLGQVSAAFFLMAALVESLNKKRLFLIGAFLGLAYLSRPHTLLSLPIFLYLLKNDIRSKNIKSYLSFLIPLFVFVGFDAIYNFTRYGIPINKGYFLIPGTLEEPWFEKGIMHPSYILEDLKIAFLGMPKILNRVPFIQPSWAGMAIWITTPAFIYSLFAPWKEKVVKLAWLSIFLIFLVVGVHGGTGFAQFGYRFAVDFYPFLIFLTIKGVARTGLKWHHWALLIFGVLVNLWGVIWINKFSWVSY